MRRLPDPLLLQSAAAFGVVGRLVPSVPSPTPGRRPRRCDCRSTIDVGPTTAVPRR